MVRIPEYKAQIYGGVILGIFALLLYFVIIPREIVFTRHQMGVSPAYFPNLLAGLLFILSICLAVDGYWKKTKKTQKEFVFIWKETRLVLVTLLVIALQTIGFDTIGYLIPAILAIAVLMYVYGHRKYITIAAVSVALPVTVKFFFESTLQVYLP